MSNSYCRFVERKGTRRRVCRKVGSVWSGSLGGGSVAPSRSRVSVVGGRGAAGGVGEASSEVRTTREDTVAPRPPFVVSVSLTLRGSYPRGVSPDVGPTSYGLGHQVTLWRRREQTECDGGAWGFHTAVNLLRARVDLGTPPGHSLTGGWGQGWSTYQDADSVPPTLFPSLGG